MKNCLQLGGHSRGGGGDRDEGRARRDDGGGRDGPGDGSNDRHGDAGAAEAEGGDRRVPSLRSVATDCRGASPPFAAKEDLFDYRFGTTRSLSVRDQLGRVRGQSFGVNVILVCRESFDAGDIRQVAGAVQEARDLFAQKGIGIREVEWYQVPKSEANGHCGIGVGGPSHGEAKALTQDWTVDNDLMDLFVVQTVTEKDGWSAIDGECDKQTGGCKSQMSGSVLELFEPTTTMGILMAHELGHYFGLEHTSRTNNFMNGTVSPSHTNITTAQSEVIKHKDCFTTEAC
jgi:hypothetical protein